PRTPPRHPPSLHAALPISNSTSLRAPYGLPTDSSPFWAPSRSRRPKPRTAPRSKALFGPISKCSLPSEAPATGAPTRRKTWSGTPPRSALTPRASGPASTAKTPRSTRKAPTSGRCSWESPAPPRFSSTAKGSKSTATRLLSERSRRPFARRSNEQPKPPLARVGVGPFHRRPRRVDLLVAREIGQRPPHLRSVGRLHQRQRESLFGDLWHPGSRLGRVDVPLPRGDRPLLAIFS